MIVRLLLTVKGKYAYAFMKTYPLAKDEEEARSMMFRDHSDQIMDTVWEGGRVQYNVERLDTTN